mgnify:CR=1 FL=1|jgi:small subunit ribosomal protein S21
MRKDKKRKSFGLTVIVEEGRFEKAMRLFKKKVDDSGLLKEIRDRQEYVKPTTRRKMARNAAKRRWQKHLESESLTKKLY